MICYNALKTVEIVIKNNDISVATTITITDTIHSTREDLPNGHHTIRTKFLCIIPKDDAKLLGIYQEQWLTMNQIKGFEEMKLC